MEVASAFFPQIIGKGGQTKTMLEKFEVSGLEYMNDDPAEVDVLYAGVIDKSGHLQEVVEGIGNWSKFL